MTDNKIQMFIYFTEWSMTLFSYSVTIVSFLIISSWFSFLGIIPTILATLYWIPKIKNQVKKYHKGSWKAWLKAIFKSK